MKLFIIIILCVVPAFHICFAQQNLLNADKYSKRRIYDNLRSRSQIARPETLIQPLEMGLDRNSEQSNTASAMASGIPKILEMIEDAAKSKSSGPINLNLIVVPVPMIQEKVGGAQNSLDPAVSDDSERDDASSQASDLPGQGIIPSQTNCKNDEVYRQQLKECVKMGGVPPPVKGGGRRSIKPRHRRPSRRTSRTLY